MTFYSDLTRCEYFEHHGLPGAELIAIGWLARSHPYSQGQVPPEFVEALFDRIETIWDPIGFRGIHPCEFCRKDRVEMTDGRGRSVAVGATNLFVPTRRRSGVFAAPSLILHYVVDHGYAPPRSFQAALMQCPPTDSVEYIRQMGARMPGLEGYPHAYLLPLGQALAKQAGLMDIHGWRRFEERHCADGSADPAQWPDSPPAWFEAEHIAPVRTLAARLESQGSAGDAKAVRTWVEAFEFFARHAPLQRVAIE